MTYLVEVDAAVDAAGTVETLRFSDDGYTTRPTETPANAYYEPRITQPGSIARTMFSGGTSGRSQVGYGEIELANIDGGLDYVKDYGFDGRRLTVRIGAAGAAYADFAVAFTGSAEQPTLDWSKLSFTLRDRLSELSKPLLQYRYQGANILPEGLEGEAQDLQGKVKPRAYGRALNVSPPCCNTARLIYEVGICADIPSAYDRGAALTRGADYTSQLGMEANPPTAGYYRAWPAGGYFRLGSSPAGQVTADVTQGASAGDRTVARLLRQIALDAGIADADVSIADVVALDALNAAEAGIWVSDEITAIDAMDALAASIGAWFGFDRLGMLRMGRLDIPTGTPAATLTRANITALERVASQDAGNGLPCWRATVSYARNWTVQSSDLAGSVTDSRRTWLSLASRAINADDATVCSQHLLAVEMARDTLLIQAADSVAEANRLLNLYKVKRETYQATVRFDAALARSVDLGSIVKLQVDRFGLAAGKLFVVIGITTDFRNNSVELTLYG